MSITALTVEPAEIRAGDTISWLITVADYPASSGWTLKYQFSNASAAFTLSSTASGADHAVNVTAETTDDYTAGTYQVLKYVEAGAGATLERVTLAEFSTKVLPFRAGSSVASDQRSHVKKTLDSLEALIEGRASRADEEYEIDTGGTRRRLKFLKPKELLEWRSHYNTLYKQELAADAVAQGKPSGGRILMRL